MKITQFMIARGFGGAERYFVDLSLALAGLGHDVQVICHEQFRGLPLFGDRTNLQVQTLSVSGWWDILARKRAARAVNVFMPDVIHAHLARGAYMAGKIAARTDIPLVVKTHNYVNLKYYKQVDIFLPTTADQKDYLRSKGVDPQRIRVIPNFSAIQPTQGVDIPDGPQAKVICSLGRMVRKKGFDVLLRAIREVIDAGVDVNLRLGGDGPEKQNLMQLCADLGLNDRIVFSGWVDDVGQFLQDAALFVLPSFDEPFGIVLLEAMARGKPIVTTSTQGPREILDDNTAWFCESGNSEELANRIIRATSDREACIQKAKQALKRFRQVYAQDKVVPELIRIYQSLTG